MSDALLERAREAARGLRAHLATLLLFRADDADLEARARRLRTAIGEFLDEPRGYLARALRAWPPQGGAQRNRIDAALLRADALRDEAERIARIHEARRELRARFQRLEQRFAPRLPVLWRQVADGAELAARIARVSTATAALDAAESLVHARSALERRAADLAALEQEALACADPDRAAAVAQGEDLEARLSVVLHLAAERASRQRAEYARTLARATERYIAHVRGAAPGDGSTGRPER